MPISTHIIRTNPTTTMTDHNSNQYETFLRLLTKVDRKELIEKSVSKKFTKGEYIVRVKDNDTNVYLIHGGSVRATLFSDEGREVSFVDIEAGGNFGEFSAIDGKPRLANVIALSDTEITIVSLQDFLNILQKYPTVCIYFLRQLVETVRQLSNRVFEHSTFAVNRRIHAQLLRIATENLDFDGIARINNPPTQIALASQVSCAREAISRELKRLEKLDIIERRRKQLIVKDYKRLRELLNGAF